MSIPSSSIVLFQQKSNTKKRFPLSRNLRNFATFQCHSQGPVLLHSDQSQPLTPFPPTRSNNPQTQTRHPTFNQPFQYLSLPLPPLDNLFISNPTSERSHPIQTLPPPASIPNSIPRQISLSSQEFQFEQLAQERVEG